MKKCKFLKIIGYENKIYGEDKEGVEIEKYIADILHVNDNIYINCDAVNASLINQNNSRVIYSFTNKNFPWSIISK